MLRALALRVPELSVLIILIAAGYIVMAVFSRVHATEVLTPFSMWLIIIASFIISMVIAIIAVIAGIGGGVMFTPIMLGFTSIDSLVVRATGLVVAMFGGLISSGPFMKARLANLRVTFFARSPSLLELSPAVSAPSICTTFWEPKVTARFAFRSGF